MPKNPIDEKNAAQAEMLFNRLRKRERHLKKWARRTGNEVFRLYDRDIPEIPLVLDRCQDAVFGALYRRPYEKPPEEEARWLLTMRDAVARALEIDPALIFLKERGRQRGNSQYDRMQTQQTTRDVLEGGLCFRLNLSDYLDTGLFPDRRLLRGLVREAARGKRVLNLFCYTAAFSVYAAAGGAREVDSVDMSRTYLDWGETNFRLNHLSARQTSTGELLRGGLPPFRLIRADALRFIEEGQRAGLSWDMIILDPPAFSNSKGMQTTLDILRDHRQLITRCLALLNPGGTLYFSANPRRFRLEREDFPQTEVRDMTEQIRDEDFKGKHIPACYSFTLK
jgi:23S rRNA G2069 N7-methylase RlmK/C1962 C5-methylase RlmI